MHFQQDPNDPQKWIITNDSGASALSNSAKKPRASAPTSQFSAPNSTKANLSGNVPSDTNSNSNFLSTPSTSFNNSTLSPKKQSKRIACNCPNCVNSVPGQRVTYVLIFIIKH